MSRKDVQQITARIRRAKATVLWAMDMANDPDRHVEASTLTADERNVLVAHIRDQLDELHTALKATRPTPTRNTTGGSRRSGSGGSDPGKPEEGPFIPPPPSRDIPEEPIPIPGGPFIPPPP